MRLPVGRRRCENVQKIYILDEMIILHAVRLLEMEALNTYCFIDFIAIFFDYLLNRSMVVMSVFYTLIKIVNLGNEINQLISVRCGERMSNS